MIGYPADWKKPNRDKRDRNGSWGDKRSGPRAAYVNTSESPIPGLTAIQYERLMQTLNGEAEGKRDSQTTGQSKQAVANMAGKCTTNFALIK